jgi:hypothetical protein
MNDLLKRAARLAPTLMAVPTTRDLRTQAMMKAARWAVGRAMPPKRPSTASYAAKGLAAAAVTLPIGLWLGTRLRSRSGE